MLDHLRGAPARLGAAVLLVFYAFVGFESGLVPAGEARDPRRDMPRALYWAIAIVALPALRRCDADQPGVLRLPGGQFIPGIAILVCLALLTQVKSADYLVTGAMLGVGGLLYLLARRT